MTTTMKTTGLLMALTLFGLGCDPEIIEHPETATDATTEMSAEESFPSDVATAYCSMLFACGGADSCEAYERPPYDDEPGCVAYEQAKLEELRTNALAGGLHFDATCVETVLTTYATIGCNSEWQSKLRLPPQQLLEAVNCNPFVGDVPRYDGTCTEPAGTNVSDCEPGNYCGESSCVPYDWPEVCDCEEGMTCTENSIDRSVCMGIATMGEQCYAGGVRAAYCEAGTVCVIDPVDGQELDGFCQPQAAIGEPCEGWDVCESLSCTDGVCTPPRSVLCQYPPRRWRSSHLG